MISIIMMYGKEVKMFDKVIIQYSEPLVLILYLVLVFLSIQIWFLWRDVDRNELKIIISDSFFKKNCVYVFSFSSIFLFFGFWDGLLSITYLKIFQMLAPFCLILFAYDWYQIIKRCTNKKTLPIELTDFHKIFN
jgi:hypothetical protein